MPRAIPKNTSRIVQFDEACSQVPLSRLALWCVPQPWHIIDKAPVPGELRIRRESLIVREVERSLREVNLFRSLPEESRRLIEQRCSWRSFEPGEQVIDYRDSSRDVYFLVSGRARVIIYSFEGQAVSFRDLEPGDVFGELSAIDGRARSAGVEAKTPCLIASMSPDAFVDTLREDREVALTAISYLVKLVRDLTDRVFEFSTLAVNNRIHAELLRLCRRAAPAGKEAVLSPAPTHADIASRISTHREAVSREMSRLARIGLVERRGSSIVVTDVKRLERMVAQATGDDWEEPFSTRADRR